MKRTLWAMLLLTGCVDLSRPRAYQCASDGECVAPWVCLRDGYCHDPAAGAGVPCDSTADCTADWFCGKDLECHDPRLPRALACDGDAHCSPGWFCGKDGSCHDSVVGLPLACAIDAQCAGGWFCAQDLQCHDPSVGASLPCSQQSHCSAGWFCAQDHVCHDPAFPSALPCAADSSCLGGWRCSIEGVCVDTTQQARPIAPPQSPPMTTRRSPLMPPAIGLFPSPVSTEGNPNDGGVLRASRSAMTTSDGTLWSAELLLEDDGEVLRASTSIAPLLPDVTHGALSGPYALVVRSDGGVLLLGRDAGQLLALPADEAAKITPLAWSPPGQPVDTWGFAVRGASPLTGVKQVNPDGGWVALATGLNVNEAVSLQVIDGGTPMLLATGPHPGPLASSVWWLESVPRADTTQADLGTLPYGPLSGREPLSVRQGPGGLVMRIRNNRFTVPDTVQPVCPECNKPGSPGSEFGCNNGDLQDFSVSAPDTVELLCGQSPGLVWSFDTRTGFGLPTRSYPARMAASASGGYVRQLEAGQLCLGDSLQDDLCTLLDARPLALGHLGLALAASTGPSLYLTHPRGLGLVQAAKTPRARVVGFVRGADAVVLGGGLVASPADGTVPFLFQGLPALARADAAMYRWGQSQVLVAAGGDALWTGVKQPSATALATPVLRPAPGFELDSLALQPADGGFVEGWATSNNRVFRITASAPDRFKVNELSVGQREPLAVWFSGGAAQLGTAAGEVLSLPARVVEAPPTGQAVTSMAHACDTTLAATDVGVLQLVTTDGGVAWTPALVPSGLLHPVVMAADQQLFVGAEGGELYEVPVTCPP